MTDDQPRAWQGSVGPAPVEPWSTPAASTGPAPGDLKIRERRSWRTWQLVVVAVIGLLVGMVIGNSGGGSASTKSGGGGTYNLPPPSGSGSSTTSTIASSTTTSSSAATTSSGPPTSNPTGNVQVLLAPPQSRGNYISTPFTVSAGTWNIGWAYQCAPAPASGPAFQVFVTPPGSSASGAPAVSGTAASGQAITPQTSAGTAVLQIQTPSSCTWIVKVTGVP